jgi:hypothetical protein
VALSPGTRLGPYEITAPLGVGGFVGARRPFDFAQDRQMADLEHRHEVVFIQNFFDELRRRVPLEK